MGRIPVTDRTALDVIVAMPDPSIKYPQDKEWCLVREDGSWQEFRFHDYRRIYRIPGLYEHLFYEVLECASPHTVRTLLQDALDHAGVAARELRVLDLGAGNGIMGRELSDMGSEYLVGIDVHQEAAHAAERDHPDVYDAYHVLDLSSMSTTQRDRLAAHRPNALCCVAALGFGDIPTSAFRAAYNLVADNGWIAFNLHDQFFTRNTDDSGFAALLRRAVTRGAFEIHTRHRYQHRLSTNGDPIYYVAIVGQKKSDL